MFYCTFVLILAIRICLVNVNFFLNNLSPTGTPFKVVRKDQIKAFLSDNPAIHLESMPIIPGKVQFNPETEGILFEVQLNNSSVTLILLDSVGKCLFFVEPFYNSFVKDKFFIDSRDNSKLNAVTSISANLNNKWLDRSFSLSGKREGIRIYYYHVYNLCIYVDWTNEESIDEDSLKKNNKLVHKMMRRITK